MNAKAHAKPTSSFWLISGAALIWNLFGLMIFVQTMMMTTEDRAAAFNEAQVRFLDSIPMWATAANGIAVVLGVAGCVLLLVRRALAVPVLIVSLAAIIVQDLHTFVLNDAVALFGMFPVYIQSAVLVIAIALIVYARKAAGRGLLK